MGRLVRQTGVGRREKHCGRRNARKVSVRMTWGLALCRWHPAEGLVGRLEGSAAFRGNVRNLQTVFEKEFIEEFGTNMACE